MSTFALVHGAHHGAWAWSYLVPALERRGHEVVAVDLPCEDVTAGVSRYARIVVDALAGRDDALVVGHSLGGLVVPVVASIRSLRRMVFIAAVVPEPGRSLAEQAAADPRMRARGSKIDNSDGTQSRPPDEAVRRYYHDCDDAARRYALARLRRQARTPALEPSPLAVWPAVPATYIICAHDRAVDPAYQRDAARRLGAETIELRSSHSPFLSRPAELARVLDAVATGQTAPDPIRVTA